MDSIEQLRRRSEQWELVAERQRRERRTRKPLTSTEAIAAALELIAIAESGLRRPDPVRERGVLAVRRQWAILRAALS